MAKYKESITPEQLIAYRDQIMKNLQDVVDLLQELRHKHGFLMKKQALSTLTTIKILLAKSKMKYPN